MRVLPLLFQGSFIRYAIAATQASSLLWYPRPADTDFYSALAVGNGRLGAMLHGYTDQELIRLNEDSIWSGGPRDRVNAEALPNLPSLREEILNGSRTNADNNWIWHFTGTPSDMRAYLPAGELRLDFPHPVNSTSKYNRTLDISTGLSTVSYKYDNIAYKREAIANAPTNVLAFRLSTSKPKSLIFKAALTRDQNVTTIAADAKSLTLTLKGVSRDDTSIHYTSQARLVLSGGDISGANEVIIFYDAETSWRYPNGTAEYEQVVASRLESAVGSGWAGISSQATSDYQSFYARSSIDLGNSGAEGLKDTATRISDWQNGTNVTADPELLTLGFNMGKYLLISSSRPGTLPANLQGIWNKDYIPPWDSKWTLNINLEMNYWLAQPNNLPEIANPIYDLLDRLRVTGTHVAKTMYNATGWCCHHNTDITADCVPYHASTSFSPFPLGGAWLSFELIEHYRFTGDTEFAANVALPILKDAVAFIRSYTTLKDGYYVTNPGSSPENEYVIPKYMTVAGNTTGLDDGVMVDRGIMHQVMSGFIELSNAVKSTDGVAEATEFLSKIEPPAIGSLGQLLEWSKEFNETDVGHRHFSPLLCVHPGTWISPLTNRTASDAAYTLLQQRIQNGSGSTGWSAVWASALYARLFDAANALHWACDMITEWMFETLLGRNGSYFQIDGNLGLVSAITEMLLQSHAGVVHLGPALPTTGIATGSAKGFVARGGFLVDMAWKDGMVTEATLTSIKGNPLRLRVQDGRDFKINGTTSSDEIQTEEGHKYEVTF
ncbi:hypothetical protein NA57DRAFT_36854 [Rhizodiscina lignyota]|uniref:Glycosyl hydrolase family 95 N-terminal domain-containing protein n=1 Tax=Rhizodiscina lignyota TaxID=1504668 RepID=A0A9P4IHV2_9PEZI|nr:hypothetical protein NA57DRAFT_36854 [Rhizodiscina lignyota]